MKSTFVVASANIQNTPDLARWKVEQAARLLERDYADIVGLQEIREVEDLIDVRQGLGPDYEVAHQGKSSPIAVHQMKFVIESTDVYQFHEGSGRIPTPTRQAVRARLKRKRRPGHPRTSVFNAHMINGAFNNNHPETKEMRRVLWNHSYSVFANAVDGALDQGDNVIIVGDMNCPDMPKFKARQEWIFNKRNDKIAVIMQPGWKCVVEKTWEINNASDHNALLARLTFKKA